MKFYQLSLCVVLCGCSSMNYNPFADEKISKAPICQSNLQTLVENDSFIEVKTLVDKECNNIVVQGWVKGKINNSFDRRCKASYQYLTERPALEKVAKSFLQNECYTENPNKFYWKTSVKNG
ncbi:hypothetical protein [Catenovulum agarivorans]|uniref:hypothetical protein n=1 Tax=Catenovulum agarivorans TaxID=1172192 RepID=UPI00058FCF01|nr:hypothetical protein [Catenovulum agarivorans]